VSINKNVNQSTRYPLEKLGSTRGLQERDDL
jgi:hypothetical protein